MTKPDKNTYDTARHPVEGGGLRGRENLQRLAKLIPNDQQALIVKLIRYDQQAKQQCKGNTSHEKRQTKEALQIHEGRTVGHVLQKRRPLISSARV